MTVKKLIEELKKMPQNLEVYVADHDHGAYEVSSGTSDVTLINQDEANNYERLDSCFKSQPKKYVVIHA